MTDMPLIPATTGRKIPWMEIAVAVLAVVMIVVAGLFWKMLSGIDTRMGTVDARLTVLDGRITSMEAAADEADVTGGVQPGAQGVEVMRIAYGTGADAVVYLCSGQIKQAMMEDADTRYCVGTFHLVLRQTGKNDVVLDTGVVGSPELSPILSGAKFVELLGKDDSGFTTEANRLFISFASNACLTAGDCGVGMPENYVRYVVNLGTGEVLRPRNYPERGELIWNSDYSRAVFIQQNCGGAGCSAAPLQGYDLALDGTRSITTEMAAQEVGAKDVQGNALPYWTDVRWSGPSDIHAIIISPSGARQTVTVPFM